MDNPDYFALFEQYRLEEDPTERELLLAEIYQFNSPLTLAEEELFDYVRKDYIADNPGIIGNSYSSYVGVYISDTGEVT